VARTVVNVPLQPRHASFIGGGCSSAGSLAILAAMRRASSRVSDLPHVYAPARLLRAGFE
jgi:hypothetical protein